MFTEEWPSKKRGRDDDDDYGTPGFSEHRTKRRIASLPHRASPKLHRQTTPPFGTSDVDTHLAPSTITPADSDSEDMQAAAEPKSFFSPWSSSPTRVLCESSQISPCLIVSSQLTNMSDIPMYSDDFEMTDSAHLSPGSFHNDPSMNISGRIPTPINCSFSPYVRSDKLPSGSYEDFADDESVVDRYRRGRRLPSPISEGEMSPSIIVEGLGDMQMEVETAAEPQQKHDKETPTKKGHSRSKHSLRNWSGFAGDIGDNGSGMKRSFSMGYRSDCEKCRMKVPGHFSHIITY